MHITNVTLDFSSSSYAILINIKPTVIKSIGEVGRRG